MKLKAILMLVAATLGTGCVYGPFYDDTLESTTSLVKFNLYSTQAGATMTAECSTHVGPFSEFGSVTASNTPFTFNDETLYSAKLERVIPADCWDYAFGKPLTFLRFFQKKGGTTYNVQVFDNDAPACINNLVGEGQGFVSAGYACRKTDSNNNLRIFANF